MKIREIALTVVFATSAVAFALGAQVRPVDGAFILARGGVSAAYLWNATPFVARLVTEKVLGADGIHSLEATAIEALAERAEHSSANSLSVKIVYARTGAVSAVYGTPTFAGMENVLTLSADRRALLKNHTRWAQNIQSGGPPEGVHVMLTGKLPAE